MEYPGERPPSDDDGREEAAPRDDSPDRALRRLRSHLPVSPLPWHWHRRINRGTVVALAVLVVGGAVASVLAQRASDDAGDPPRGTGPPKELKGKLERLSLSEKTGQVVIAGFADPAAAGKEAALGGILVGAEDWAGSGRGVISRLRGAAGADAVPPLIVGVQEGGVHRAYGDLPPAETQVEIGARADPALAESWAAQAGAALGKAGFDLNLAPIADIATPDSPIGDRSFGDDPALVETLVRGAVRGCESTGLACALAHFPGEGGASDDTARGPATVSLDPASLASRDLAAFRAGFKAGAPATVLSLAFFAAYDPVTPGALSPSIATELLRDELGFTGVAITDDLTAGAIAAGVGAPEAAVQALAAGADMVLVDDPVAAAQARAAILAAAKRGSLSAERLEQAVGRVLELKRRVGLL